MALAQYTFASAVRRGFQPTADAKATVTVAVTGQQPIVRDVEMMTAGDVDGVPAAQVIRSYPRHDSVNVEPNYLALVELDSPDLPWLFSRPAPDGKLHPWMCLAVIDETGLGDPLSASPIGTKLTVSADQLPDPAEAWLWAHAQLLGSDTVPGDPTRSLARLVCPRRLRASRSYLACLVPTLEAARLAGLGTDPGDQRLSTAFAWQPVQGDVTLPVYHWFRFSTGPSGDFEALVRRLKGVPLPAGLGRRRLRLDNPVSGLPAPDPAGADVELHVALRPPGEQLDPIVPLVGQSYLDVLKSRLVDAGYDISLLTASPDAPPPEVGPPVWGQLPVGPTAVAAALGSGAVPPWLTELNTDPRLRVAAGLGAEVVRRNQDHYLESAWKQVGDVLAANRLRRRAEFSLATSMRLHARWLTPLTSGDLLTATAPVHAKVRSGAGETLVGRLRDSPLPPAVVSVEFRRFTRTRGSATVAQIRSTLDVAVLQERSAEVSPLVKRIPLDSIDVLAAPSTVWGVEQTAQLLDVLAPDNGQTDLAVKAAAFDTVSTLVAAADVPTSDVVLAQFQAAAPSAAALLTGAGFLPAAVVRSAVDPAQPPVAQPPFGVRARQVGGAHQFGQAVEDRAVQIEHGIQLGHGIQVRDGIQVDQALQIGQLLDRRLRFDPIEIAQRGRDAAQLGTRSWLSGQPGSRVSVVLAADHGLVRQAAGDAISIDGAALQRRTRTGVEATTLDAPTLTSITNGSFRPPVLEPLTFEAPERSAAVTARFGDIFAGIADHQVRGGVAAPSTVRPLAGGLDGVRNLVLAALDPRTSLVAAVNSRIGALLGDQAQHFDPIMAAPDLSEPTYLQLSAISHDWLLPGIDALPTDTTTLVAANRAFIAGFLVGMNHELARELVWHEYPTDQRGSYARQFWTHKNTGNPADRYDLRHELHAAPTLSLSRLNGDGDDPLVLVIKGDLVRRYPGVLVTAAHTAGPDGKRLLDPATQVEPDFVGLLEPDVLLVGFEKLTEPIVRAAMGDAATAWWFFFAEHFAEPRFGLDELVENHVELGPDEHRPFGGADRTWNDAAWQHATLDARGFLTAASFTDSLRKGTDDGSPTKHRWAENPAVQAWIALQFPFRRGVEARLLLPPEAPA